MRLITTASMLAILMFTSAARATSYDEAVNGDLSGDRLAPTAIALTPGANPISATSVSGDIEYFTVSVPAGFRVTSITLTNYVAGNLSFLAIQTGTTFTEPPTGTNVAQLLGYTHFGVGNSTVGTDILDNLGTGAGSKMFVSPLPAGNYVFWSQETSGVPVSYTFSFQVTAAPAVPAAPPVFLALFAAGLVAIGARRIRSARRGSLGTTA